VKIAFNRKIRRSPWGGGAHFAVVLEDYLVKIGHSIVHNLEEGIDVIIMLDPRQEEGGFGISEIIEYKERCPNVKILHRVNDTDYARGLKASSGDDRAYLEPLIIWANRYADQTVYISKWVQGHYQERSREWTKPMNVGTVITNGCDTSFFYPKTERELHKPLRLVTHHWSTNPNKGLDLYKHIDELIDCGANLEFTYVGRYPVGHVPKHTKIVAPLYGTELGDELRKHDVYVTAARHEACGSHHIEGAACGMPVIYHNEGGGVVEMCSRYGVGIDDVSDFKQALTKIKNHYDSYRWSAESADLSAETMCEKYLELIKRM
jgi:glycosyltransferase involved in cell wall biosynthesis